MRIFEITLAGGIYWKIHRNDPATQALSSLPGCFFVNPLVYPKLTSTRFGLQITALGSTKDTIILRTNSIILGTNQNQIDIASLQFDFESAKIIDVSDSPDSDFAVISAYVGRFTASLRLASKQVDVPVAFIRLSPGEHPGLPQLHFPQENSDSEWFLQKYIWDTAVCWNHLLIADEEIINKTIPIHEKLILDAIHALNRCNSLVRRANRFSLAKIGFCKVVFIYGDRYLVRQLVARILTCAQTTLVDFLNSKANQHLH